MKFIISIILFMFLVGCGSVQYVPTPVPVNVYVWMPIPSNLLVTCQGGTFTKGMNWKDFSVAAKEEQAANQAYAVYMQSIKTLVASAPPQTSSVSPAVAHARTMISPKLAQLCTSLK